jgi:hypothetical protein
MKAPVTCHSALRVRAFLRGGSHVAQYAIAAALNERGIPTASGSGRRQATSLSNLLLHEPFKCAGRRGPNDNDSSRRRLFVRFLDHSRNRLLPSAFPHRCFDPRRKSPFVVGGQNSASRKRPADRYRQT